MPSLAGATEWFGSTQAGAEEWRRATDFGPFLVHQLWICKENLALSELGVTDASTKGCG
jgi:hypothetical protein